MGASAVLLFAVPSSPLAQPWPIIGGNVISALVGVAAAHLIPNVAVAAGVAVGLAIAAMSVTRSLHPPGGAAALLAVVSGPEPSTWLFPLAPVGINAVLLTLLGIGFHLLTPHRYPARAAGPQPSPHGTTDRPPTARLGVQSQDIDKAISDIGEAFDIARDDLARLIRRVEQRALERTHGRLTCADVMARDVIKVGAGTAAAAAKNIVLERGVRLLPVVAVDDRVV
jgi:CBS domain-containing membrane protein